MSTSRTIHGTTIGKVMLPERYWLRRQRPIDTQGDGYMSNSQAINYEVLEQHLAEFACFAKLGKNALVYCVAHPDALRRCGIEPRASAIRRKDGSLYLVFDSARLHALLEKAGGQQAKAPSGAVTAKEAAPEPKQHETAPGATQPCQTVPSATKHDETGSNRAKQGETGVVCQTVGKDIQATARPTSQPVVLELPTSLNLDPFILLLVLLDQVFKLPLFKGMPQETYCEACAILSRRRENP